MSAQNMKIRKGEIADMARVLELIKELALFEKEPDAVVITLDDLKRDGFGENPLFYTFVAELNSVIVGAALYYYRYSTWKGRTIHLEDLIVTHEFRGKGIGLALYKQVILQGQMEGVRRMEWNVLDWNTPAIAFYETSGARILKDWQVVQMDEIGIQKFIENN